MRRMGAQVATISANSMGGATGGGLVFCEIARIRAPDHLHPWKVVAILPSKLAV